MPLKPQISQLRTHLDLLGHLDLLDLLDHHNNHHKAFLEYKHNTRFYNKYHNIHYLSFQVVVEHKQAVVVVDNNLVDHHNHLVDHIHLVGHNLLVDRSHLVDHMVVARYQC